MTAVYEVGAGANPALPCEFVDRHNLDYVIMDVSASELAKAPRKYKKLNRDIMAPPTETESYDLVFSRMVAEHVTDPSLFHRRILERLSPDGVVLHFFPTLYAPGFVLNRILPFDLSDRLLQVFQPGREPEGRHRKFPAYYNWCWGPTDRQLQRFRHLGYRIVEYVGFFGQPGYFGRLPMLAALDRHVALVLVSHPVPSLTSYAYVVLAKR